MVTKPDLAKIEKAELPGESGIENCGGVWVIWQQPQPAFRPRKWTLAWVPVSMLDFVREG